MDKALTEEQFNYALNGKYSADKDFPLIGSNSNLSLLERELFHYLWRLRRTLKGENWFISKFDKNDKLLKYDHLLDIFFSKLDYDIPLSISNKMLAFKLNTSEKSITIALNKLENKNLIKRKTNFDPETKKKIRIIFINNVEYLKYKKICKENNYNYIINPFNCLKNCFKNKNFNQLILTEKKSNFSFRPERQNDVINYICFIIIKHILLLLFHNNNKICFMRNSSACFFNLNFIINNPNYNLPNFNFNFDSNNNLLSVNFDFDSNINLINNSNIDLIENKHHLSNTNNEIQDLNMNKNNNLQENKHHLSDTNNESLLKRIDYLFNKINNLYEGNRLLLKEIKKLDSYKLLKTNLFKNKLKRRNTIYDSEDCEIYDLDSKNCAENPGIAQKTIDNITNIAEKAKPVIKKIINKPEKDHWKRYFKHSYNFSDDCFDVMEHWLSFKNLTKHRVSSKIFRYSLETIQKKLKTYSKQQLLNSITAFNKLCDDSEIIAGTAIPGCKPSCKEFFDGFSQDTKARIDTNKVTYFENGFTTWFKECCEGSRKAAKDENIKKFTKYKDENPEITEKVLYYFENWGYEKDITKLDKNTRNDFIVATKRFLEFWNKYYKRININDIEHEHVLRKVFQSLEDDGKKQRIETLKNTWFWNDYFLNYLDETGYLNSDESNFLTKEERREMQKQERLSLPKREQYPEDPDELYHNYC